MKHFRSSLLATALFAPVAAAGHGTNVMDLVGHFKTLDRNVPGCGVLYMGSKATFVSQADQQEISIVVPCIDMQTVKTDSPQTVKIELDKTYRIRVTPIRPENMSLPLPSSDFLYLIEVVDNRPAA
ncbi:MAG: hypothetical protein EOO15_14640 [Chitinophagaceae bacterium]|nr:MAG: hypothetical protein EOO15_14640 [Chitinophagaceae bacterium]